MQVISSKENEQIKNIKKLKEKKYRDETGEYIIEGIKLIKEAIEENVPIKTIVVCEDCEEYNLEKVKSAINGNSKKENMQEDEAIAKNSIEQGLRYEIAKFDCIYVTKKIFSILSEVQTPQGILAVVEKRNNNNTINYDEDFILALDDIQDPGNLGTILRTADSANLKQIILSANSADPYNSKVVRSTMGAIFRMNTIRTESLLKTLQEIKKHKFEIIATSLETNKSVYDIKYNKKVVVIGNEANGVSKEILNLANEKVKIPMLGKTESLNASVAAGIMIYEYVRGKIR